MEEGGKKLRRGNGMTGTSREAYFLNGSHKVGMSQGQH
jgi:hypothetical protein